MHIQHYIITVVLLLFTIYFQYSTQATACTSSTSVTMSQVVDCMLEYIPTESTSHTFQRRIPTLEEKSEWRRVTKEMLTVTSKSECLTVELLVLKSSYSIVWRNEQACILD